MADPDGLRRVRDADGPALIALIEGCWSEYPGCVMDVDGEEPWLRAPATAYAAWGGRLWVVEGAAGLDACGGYKPPHDGWAELKNMYVAAPARRRGLATRLAGLVLDAAREAGAAGVLLWSDTRFHDAHRFYAGAGFSRTGRTRDLHDRSNTTEYEFRLAL